MADDADNKPANSLCQKCGFALVCQIQNHGILSNIYAGATTTHPKTSQNAIYGIGNANNGGFGMGSNYFENR